MPEAPGVPKGAKASKWKLSPAATDPSYSPPGPPPASLGLPRGTESVRPDVPALHRSVSSPEFGMPDITPAALDDARTVPVPPSSRPAAATATRPTGAPAIIRLPPKLLCTSTPTV